MGGCGEGPVGDGGMVLVVGEDVGEMVVGTMVGGGAGA
jgi:hypothetical protein